ncbi:MAG: glycerophosphodiester phosphodiesterase [Spirochaetales bacterium]|nr:glycerophosphodiester phosphodiesterase [Spirochaetales bacterium]
MEKFFSDLAARRKVLVFGHRGMSQHYPENTMLSFSRCAESPLIDGVELDVHLCRSGEVVVAHDFSLKRTAGIDHEIESFTLDELNSIDVGSFKGEGFSDCRVPLLRELFSSFGDRFVYDVELKVKAGQVNPELCRKTLDIIREFHLEDRVVVSSFNPFALRAFRGISRREGIHLPMADIFAHSKDIPKILWDGAGHVASGSTYQKPSCEQIDAAYMKRHGRLPIITWTVNTAEEARRLLAFNRDEMKVFGLIGNDPEMLSEVVNP